MHAVAITKYILISVKQISLQQLSEVQQWDVWISQHRRKRIPGWRAGRWKCPCYTINIIRVLLLLLSQWLVTYRVGLFVCWWLPLVVPPTPLLPLVVAPTPLLPLVVPPTPLLPLVVPPTPLLPLAVNLSYYVNHPSTASLSFRHIAQLNDNAVANCIFTRRLEETTRTASDHMERVLNDLKSHNCHWLNQWNEIG